MSSSKITLVSVPFVDIHKDMSYESFFNRYNPYRDGKVYAATYSFRHEDFSFWSKLEPLSVFYVDHNYEKSALSFLRRFPLFEVYSVPHLHTKAIFLQKSGVFLIGSENLWARFSSFSELMVEICVPETDRKQVVDSFFRSLRGKILTCKYTLRDLRVHMGELEGKPFLPCHREVTYWDLIGDTVALIRGEFQRPEAEFHNPGWIYHLLEYRVNGKPYALAFDRGYAYCGDLDAEAFGWLLENCEIEEQRSTGLFAACEDDLVETSPDKDLFLRYHPIAKNQRAIRGYWLGNVKNLDNHRDRMEPVPLQNITHKKVTEDPIV